MSPLQVHVKVNDEHRSRCKKRTCKMSFRATTRVAPATQETVGGVKQQEADNDKQIGGLKSQNFISLFFYGACKTNFQLFHCYTTVYKELFIVAVQTDERRDKTDVTRSFVESIYHTDSNYI